MKKVLLVDDEIHIRELYFEELTYEGYQVSTMVSGKRIMGNLDTVKPDVIIMDIKLKDCSGLDLAREIKQLYPRIPIIMFSAYDTYQEDMKAHPAEYFVVKSFDLTEIKQTIKAALGLNMRMVA